MGKVYLGNIKGPKGDKGDRGETGPVGPISPMPPDYLSIQGYKKGDYVTYNEAIYICKEDIDVGEEWSPEHWEETTVVEEVGKARKQIKDLADRLAPMDKPIYGMIIHEQTDQVPTSRVEYIGANKDFKPMKMNMETHVMDLGDWADWEWLKGVVPVMCNWDGGIDYYLDPEDYTKRADKTTESDVSKSEYAGNAMVVIPKIYTWEYKRGTDRVVWFCERRVTDDFLPIGFNVGGIERDYMLIPMFYGSIDTNGKMRSIAGQWSCLTASGSADDVKEATLGSLSKTSGINTDIQHQAIAATSKNGLFFGGPLTNTLADICVMISHSTNSQEAFGAGMNNSYDSSGAKSTHYGTKVNTVVGGGMFYGSNDNKSFNKIFHSCVLGSYMLWQRDPYMVSVSGRIKVSTDYTYDPTGGKYLDTGIDFKPGDTSQQYYTSYNVVSGFGPVPDVATKNKGSTSTGYCDATWTNAGITSVSLRFGRCSSGLNDGLWARTLDDVATAAWWYHGASLLLPAPAAAQAAE